MQNSKCKIQNNKAKSKIPREGGYYSSTLYILRAAFRVRRSSLLRRRFFSRPDYRGFSFVETIVGGAIIAAVLAGLAQIGQFAFRLVDESNLRLRASFLAEEGQEAVRGLRDTSWSERIAPAALDTDYWLSFATSSGMWQLVSAPTPAVDGVFDRRVRSSAVFRSASDDVVASGGTLDPNTRKITVSVSWMNRGRQATTTISTYLTNLFSN